MTEAGEGAAFPVKRGRSGTMLTFEDVKNNETIRTYIQRADESLIALG